MTSTTAPLTNAYGRVLLYQSLADFQDKVAKIEKRGLLNQARIQLYQGVPGSMAHSHPMDYGSEEYYQAWDALHQRARELNLVWNKALKQFVEK